MSADTQLKLVITGHVDHGKSTLIGRLLHDTGSLPTGKLEQLQAAATRRGTPFQWANLMDALQAERNQNVTIDTAHIWFRTPRRRYVIIDAPGHREFIQNMITGAAQAEAALLLVDAVEGIQENTRRHACLLQLLGIRQLVVGINKMDLAGYREERFRSLAAELTAWLAQTGWAPSATVPLSAHAGDNLVARSPAMPWWQGPALLEALESFEPRPPLDALPLRLPIQDVYRFDDRRVLVGRVESGNVRVGDQLVFAPTNKTSMVKSIERWPSSDRDWAGAGESIGITLTEQIFVERGVMGAHATAPPVELPCFNARVFWLGLQPLRVGQHYRLRLATQEVDCEVRRIDRVLDTTTLVPVAGGPAAVARYQLGDVEVHARRSVAFDPADEHPITGRFVLVEGQEIKGGGIISPGNYPRLSHDGRHKSTNIFQVKGKVSAGDRERQRGQRGCVVWLTGLSGAGKSTVATELERELFIHGRYAYVLDGDNIRRGLCSDLGFSAEDRTENIRRVGEVARLFADAGVICVTAFISPYRADRDLVRKIIPAGRFLEVYLSAPLAVCEARDPKGLYAKARANEIKDFTGISAPYEVPVAPELELPTDRLSVADAVAEIMHKLEATERAEGGGPA